MRAVVAALLCALVVSCPKTTAPAPKRLTLGITSEPDTLCPFLTESGSAHEIIGLLWRDAVLYDPDWQRRPDLAAALPEPVVDGDKLRVHWRIRADAAWEDGTPVSARDFALAWRVQLDDTQQVVSGRDDARRIESLIPDDDSRGFTVTWREQNPFFAEPRVHRVLPAHILGDNPGPLDKHALCKKPLSNGPFLLVEWQPGQLLRFARNEHYRPRPRLDEVIVRVLPSTTALLTALEAGDIDAAFPSGGPSPVEVDAFVARHPARFQATRAGGQQWVHIDINTDNIKDARVRRALAMALPLDEIVSSISGGAYTAARGYLPPKHWGYDDTLPPLVYDVDAARPLLDGLKLQLAGASGSAEGEKLLLLLQQAWRRAGVDVSIDQRPFKVFFGEGVKKRKLPGAAVFAWTIDASSMGGAIFRSDRIPSEDNGWKGNNSTGFVNAEVTELLRQADATLDVHERKRLLARVQRVVREEMPVIPLYFKPVAVVHRADVVGLFPTGTTTPLAWNAHLWDRR